MNNNEINHNRVTQIKNIGISREEMKNGLFRYNENTINAIGEAKLREFVKEYFFEKNFSLTDIHKLQEIIYKNSGETPDDFIPVLQFLYETLTHRILLPDYNKENPEEFYQDMMKIIDRTLNRTVNIIEKLDKNPYFTFYMPRVGAIRDEFDIWWNIETRYVDIGGVFNAARIDNAGHSTFSLEIPIRIHVTESESGKKNPIISEKKIHNYLQREFEREGVDTFYYPIDDGELLIQLKKVSKPHDKEYGVEEKYMILEITHDEQLERDMTDEKMREIVDSVFECGNIIVNDIIEISGIPYKKRMYNFSNDYFLDSIEVKAFEVWEAYQEMSEVQKWGNELNSFRVQMNNKLKLNDIGGQQKAKKEIETIIKSIRHEEIMKQWWARVTSGIIFEWPSGTGKTLLAKVLASEVDAEVFVIKLTDIASDAYINTGSNKVTKLFSDIRNKAKNSKKIVIILDEMDALFGNRNDGNGTKEDTKIVNSFLTEMSGFEKIDNVIFVGTTNLLENIDPAVIRSGRFSTKIKVDLPEGWDIQEILEIHLQKAANISEKFKKILKDFPIAEASELMINKNFSGADIEEIVRIIIQNKAMEEIDGNENIILEKSDFEKAIAKIQGTDKKKWIGFTALL